MTFALYFSLLLLAYAFVGYPLLMMLLARRPSRGSRSTPPWQPRVSVCMAVHDGAPYLPAKLDNLLALTYPQHKLEILLYLDGCRDGTEAIARDYARREPRIRVIAAAERRGKPTALNRLAALAEGEVLLLTDVRQLLAPDAAEALVERLADPEVGCVSGNLVIDGPHGSGWYWRYEKMIRACEGELGTMVGVSGSIYAIRKQDFPELPADLVLDDMWVPLALALQRKRIEFSPRAMAFDRSFSDKVEFGRKVRTLGGNYQLLAHKPALLSPFTNPLWFQLVSHKLLRLLAPWLLVVMFAASWLGALVWTPESRIELQLLGLFAVLQSAFYGLALLGARAGRAGAAARSFVVLNAAAVVGLWRYARGELRVTW